MSELQGASLSRPPPGLYPGPTGELTATPRPPAEFSNDLWSLHVVPTPQLPQDWEFSFFHIGIGILDYFNVGNWDPKTPPPSGPFLKAMDFVIDIIKNGYMLPFHHTPDSCYSEKQQVSNLAQFIR